MKYLHIMPPSKRMMFAYIEMLRKIYPAENHRIIFQSAIGYGDACLLMFENTMSFEDLGKGRLKKFMALRKEFAQADRVVFHGFVPTIQWLLLLATCPDVFNKAMWVVWGIDLYNYKTKAKGIKGIIRNKIEYNFRARMKYPVVVSEADISVYQKEFGTHPVMCAPYGFIKWRFIQMEHALEQRSEKDKKTLESGNLESDKEENGIRRVNVQIGHNGFPFNRHFQMFEKMARLVEEEHDSELKMYVPISYGNGPLSKKINYVQALESYALQKFPKHVVMMKKILPNDKYTEHLAQMDIAIFNAPRHNALGNILQLLYMGKKIYMTRECPLFDYLTEKGFKLHDINELNTISYDEFIAPENDNLRHSWIKRAYSIDEGGVPMWKNVFDYCEGKLDYETAFEENRKFYQ